MKEIKSKKNKIIKILDKKKKKTMIKRAFSGNGPLKSSIFTVKSTSKIFMLAIYYLFIFIERVVVCTNPLESHFTAHRPYSTVSYALQNHWRRQWPNPVPSVYGSLLLLVRGINTLRLSTHSDLRMLFPFLPLRASNKSENII